MSDKKEIVSASPKVRKLAREFGADIYQIEGSQRKGRVSEEDEIGGASCRERV